MDKKSNGTLLDYALHMKLDYIRAYVRFSVSQLQGNRRELTNTIYIMFLRTLTHEMWL